MMQLSSPDAKTLLSWAFVFPLGYAHTKWTLRPASLHYTYRTHTSIPSSHDLEMVPVGGRSHKYRRRNGGSG
jgi:hypothetical protein